MSDPASYHCEASLPGPPPPRFDLAALRSKLAAESAGGRKYWRSLEAAADTPEFQAWLQREYPAGASEWADGPSRRQFLKIMAASIGLAGLAACTRQPQEQILPYVKQPEDLVLGVPLQYATAMTIGGYATGLLVESHEGRPTKIEGNPDHPMSLGAASVFQQAAVLELYDPDRTKTVLRAGETSSWEEFLADLVPALAEQAPKGGAGLRLLTETVTSPTQAAQIEELLTQYTRAKWHQYEPCNRDNIQFGGDGRALLEPRYHFEPARVIVALDSDFLFSHPASLAYARQFAQGRAVSSEMNRLYVAEPTPTITGSVADHRLACGAAQIAELVQGLLVMTGAPPSVPVNGWQAAWIEGAKRDLRAHRGAGLVLAGEGQPPWVHQAVHAINVACGNVGATVTYHPVVAAHPGKQTASLQELAADMHAGHVDLLVQIGGNPVYNAPADLDFAGAMGKVKRHVQCGYFYNETSVFCQWHVPQAHFLESWSDALAFDGTPSIVQPLIEPLYQGRSAHELLDALVLAQNSRGAYDIVRARWQTGQPPQAFEKAWRKMICAGLAPAPAASPSLPSFPSPAEAPDAPEPKAGYEIVFRPDPTIWDGRFSNNGWLQETPKPITKLTWDNAALFSPKLAERLNLHNEDVVELTFQGRSLHAPVWIMPGQAENSVAVHLGYGRTSAGRVGTGQGCNAYALRTTTAMYHGAGLQVRKVDGRRWRLASAQSHFSLEGRDLYRTGTLEEYDRRPDFALAEAEHPAADDTLYPPDHTYPGYAWGMAIDLNTCIGCNACIVACQAENNIPIVGKGEVSNGREMHWIRVDGYYAGAADYPRMYHQPVPCMHCENAPCEVVCPVAATVHSPEGLNEQVYNRCIGTRYCSNNCPYKVRRFNFLQWPDNTTLTLKLQRNPDVSVRSRGVMEKCTYCVQRINEAKITAEKEDRHVRDGEILTACQQTCPTEAIVFGDLNDPASRVSRLKRQPRNYQMLAELNTRPRTSYLARITNPSPEMET